MSNGVLIVAEKPSIVRAMIDVLAADSHTKRPGHSQYNWIFEFRMKIGGQASEVTVTSVNGHVKNYEFPERYSKWVACSPAELFDCTVQHNVTAGMEPIVRTLKQEAAHNSLLIIATDNDREGENIGFEIIGICREGTMRIRVIE
jgi:DNA topoisomerase III